MSEEAKEKPAKPTHRKKKGKKVRLPPPVSSGVLFFPPGARGMAGHRLAREEKMLAVICARRAPMGVFPAGKQVLLCAGFV